MRMTPLIATPVGVALKGHLQNVEVQVLVDGGSTHNFVQERLALFLRLQIVPLPHFQVLVENGEKISYSGKCSEVILDL